ncbi:MAG TPA: hypothetical protein VIM11_25110 [Tepidisphaeraceae bacterium]
MVEIRKWMGIGILCGLLAQSVSQAQAPATRPATAPVAVSIQFLSATQGRTAIVDETNDPYFKLLQPMEMSAKTGRLTTDTVEAERDECRRRYQAAVVDFTPREKQAIEALVKKITAATQDKFPVFARTPWSFIKVASGLEGGNAFTRGGNIVLPVENVATLLNRSTDKAAPKWAVLVESANLLLREQLHVVQKAQPQRFAKMYEEKWGLMHQDKLDPGEWLTEHQFLDPDAVDEHWIYEIKAGQRSRWIWPMRVMGDAHNPAGPGMADVQAVAVMLDGSPEQGFKPRTAPNGGPMTQPLLNLPQYTARFSPSEHPYHPAKAAADLFARIIVAEELLPEAKPPGAEAALVKAKERFKEMREWFERILG